MMQLVCNGVALDLYESTGLQFTQENPLFAFDNLKCERTTQFKIPATAKNDRVFDLARVPTYSGMGMRRKFAAQLQAGAIVKNGFLYITSWTGKEYDAVFVTGEMIGLQAIKDAGKVSEIMEFTETIATPYTPRSSSDPSFSTDLFAVFMYNGESGLSILPSINLGVLIDRLCAHLNVTCTLPALAYDMRIVVPELVPPAENKKAHIHSIRTGGDPKNTIYPDELQRLVTEELVVQSRITTAYRNGHNNPAGEIIQTDTNDIGVRFFVPENSIAIKFPDNFSDDYFLMGITTDGLTYFLGDYSFIKTINRIGDAQVVIIGEPLAGRTVEIEAGQRFLLATTGDMTARAVNTYIQVDDEPVAVTATTIGWQFINGLNYDFTVEVSTNEDNPINVYRLQDNLPEYTLTDILKYIAAELGFQLNYTDADGVFFDELNFDEWNIKEVAKIIERGEVTRTFMNYGQNNLVKYANDEAFLLSEQTPALYTIDNESLQKDFELITLGWTNGGFNARNAGIVAYDRNGRKEFMEIRKNAGGYLDGLRAYITKNNNLQDLCVASTQIIVTAWMMAAEYDAITANTLIQLDGTLYVWTARQWQNNVAKFTLAKIK